MNQSTGEVQKFEKSASQIKKQIEFRFLKQSGDKVDRVESYRFLTLFHSFSNQIKEEIKKSVRLNKHELPVILNYIDRRNFVLFTTEQIHFSKGLLTNKAIPLKEIKGGFFEFHNRMFEGIKDGETRSMSPGQTKNMAKMKYEGHFLDFELEFYNQKSIVFKIPKGSAAYSLINSLNVLSLVGIKYMITDYRKTDTTI